MGSDRGARVKPSRPSALLRKRSRSGAFQQAPQSFGASARGHASFFSAPPLCPRTRWPTGGASPSVSQSYLTLQAITLRTYSRGYWSHLVTNKLVRDVLGEVSVY